jgi:hypothetical protein
VDGFVHFSAIGLQKRRLTGHLHLGRRCADGQLGIDADNDPYVDAGGISRELSKALFVDSNGVISRYQTGEAIRSVVIRDCLLSHGVRNVGCLYCRPRNSGAGGISHIALDASGDRGLRMQYANTDQGKNCNKG